MKQLVLTLIGKDKAGLVEQLATIVSGHHGNWTASNLSHLGGYFAGILQLEVAAEHAAELTAALEAMPAGTTLFFKQLRKDRVLRPI